MFKKRMIKEFAVIIVQKSNGKEVSQQTLLSVEQLQQLFSNELQLQSNSFLDSSPKAINDSQNYRDLGKIFIHVNDSYICLNIDSIIKCEASGNYTKFFTDKKEEYLVSKPLKYYQDLIVFKDFFRANRSVLVNLKFVISVYKREAIVLSTNERITVSVRNKSKLLEIINKYT
ncbi:LytTR family DNA-binding domain-containing protein [Tenacibaculum sp. 190524A05c]|uniref:LytR/AlgR family response regulator transcription factor n=1 Tax=Tenacibaculum platacis TaxID=3137852 RepID=UPI0032B0FA73